MDNAYMGSETGEAAVQEFPSHSKQEEFPAEMKKELPEPFINVGTAERVLSGLGGAAIAFYGLKRNSWLGKIALSVIGGGLIARGVTGHCEGYKAMGVNTAD